MSEHNHQVAVVKWFKTQYPKYADCIVAIPNGSAFRGGMTKQNMARLKYLYAEGMKKGASDLFIAVPFGGYAGLWIEMKDAGKTFSSVSEEQRRHLTLMTNMGYKSTWCAGFDVAKEVIEEYMRPDI